MVSIFSVSFKCGNVRVRGIWRSSASGQAFTIFAHAMAVAAVSLELAASSAACGGVGRIEQAADGPCVDAGTLPRVPELPVGAQGTNAQSTAAGFSVLSANARSHAPC